VSEVTESVGVLLVSLVKMSGEAGVVGSINPLVRVACVTGNRKSVLAPVGES
jgi:hypothetical protein